MPTYEYECKKCFHRLEKFQSIKDKLLRKCPKCHNRSLERLIGSGGALIFKGSGFYITDYCRSKQKASEQKPSVEKPKKTAEKDIQNNKKS